MRRILIFVVFGIALKGGLVHGQTTTPPLLFGTTDPLHLKIRGSIKSIKKNTNDSTFVSNIIHYEPAPGRLGLYSCQREDPG